MRAMSQSIQRSQQRQRRERRERREQVVARVAANVPLCREHFRVVLSLDRFPETAPGQFIQIACRNPSENVSPEREADWEEGRPWNEPGQELMAPLALLRRPFSLAGRRDQSDTASGTELEIIYRVVGVGTGWLEHLKVGDEVGIIGPLGNTFTLPEVNQPAILVGGGVGIPPMLYLASHLARLDGRKAVAFCGAVTRDLLPLTVTTDAPTPGSESIEPLYNIHEFSQHGIPAVISTDDGSYGFRGFVTQALERYLDEFIGGSGRSAVGGEKARLNCPLPTAHRPLPMIYTCGPELMMKRVAEIATSRGIECQVAVERAMACGMGTCQSCVIRVKTEGAGVGVQGSGKDWVYKLACTDGPVFRAGELLW